MLTITFVVVINPDEALIAKFFSKSPPKFRKCHFNVVCLALKLTTLKVTLTLTSDCKCDFCIPSCININSFNDSNCGTTSFIFTNLKWTDWLGVEEEKKGMSMNSY